MNKVLSKNWACVLIIASLVMGAYYNMLDAPFKHIDDSISITNNSRIVTGGSIIEIFKSSFFGQNHYWRPLVELSFYVEYQLFKDDAFVYHLNNVLLHILNSVLVFYLMLFMLKHRLKAFCVSVLFAVHPINSELVTNIPGRSLLLETALILVSFNIFVRSEKSIIKHVVSLIFFALALLSKESALAFPAILLVYALCLHKNSLRRVIPFFVIIGVYLFVRNSLGITQVFAWDNITQALLGFITFLRANLTYFRLFIFPVDLHFDRSIPLFYSLSQAGVILTVLAYIAIFTVIFAVRKKVTALICVCLFWYAIVLFPVSQIVANIGVSPGVISVAEHFVYFASVPVFILLVELISVLQKSDKARRLLSAKIWQTLTVSFFLFLFIVTKAQSTYAESPISELKRSAQLGPHNGRVHFVLGLEYAHRGKFVEAEHYFREAQKRDPNRVKITIALAKSICDQGRLSECLSIYNKITDAGKHDELLEDNIQKTKELMQKNE